jgi:hypothetical protein
LTSPLKAGAAAGARTVLGSRVASKVTMVLRSLRVGAEDIAAAIRRGNVPTSAGDAKAVTMETLRAIRTVVPSPADVAKVKAAYVEGACDVAEASPADAFFLAMSAVPRAAAKIDALLCRATLPTRVEDARASLETAFAAATACASSDRLKKLLDVVEALSGILDRGGGAAGGASSYKLASLAKLAEVETKAKSAPTKTNASLLHHLAKTVRRVPFHITPVPVRPRSRGARRSFLKDFHFLSRRFDSDAPRRLATPTDASRRRPDVSYTRRPSAPSRRRCFSSRPSSGPCTTPRADRR